MLETLLTLIQFVWENFLHIWPYLLLTIPIAVAVNLSGASKHINRAFGARPLIAIVLATAVGAFSPFCSCTVIPVVATMLIGGVPLAPVMAFWIASPSMDPEIFFLSAGLIGWELAVWRLAGTLLLSLTAGYLTHFLFQRGWLGSQILRQKRPPRLRNTRQLLQAGWQRLRVWPAVSFFAAPAPMADGSTLAARWPATAVADEIQDSASCGSSCTLNENAEKSCDNTACTSGSEAGCQPEPPAFSRRLLTETWSATRMVVQFMALAFLLEALILLFVPQAWIVGLLGAQNQWAVPAASLLGVPIYTSNLTALPLIGGLLAQGMSPAAALAFLIAGPTTTLPAMAAVWGLVRLRIFALYILISLLGAMVLGSAYGIISG